MSLNKIKVSFQNYAMFFLKMYLTFILNTSAHSINLKNTHYIHGFEFKPQLVHPVFLDPIKKYGISNYEDNTFYPAVDYQLNELTIVHSASKGKVIISGEYQNKNILIAKSDYFYTIYKGINEFYVKKGDFIKPFQMIGKSLGILSFEVRDLNGNAYNPENYFTINKNTYLSHTVLNSKLYQSFIPFMELHGFKKNDINTMYCIAFWESSFNPVALNKNKNGTQDTGLFQINDIWLKRCGMTRKDLFNIHNNVNCARIVLEEQGFNAWSTYKRYKNGC